MLGSCRNLGFLFGSTRLKIIRPAILVAVIFEMASVQCLILHVGRNPENFFRLIFAVLFCKWNLARVSRAKVEIRFFFFFFS